MSENLKNFENLKEKKSQNSALCLIHRPPKNWPGALDHLAIGSVDNKYTQLGKISKKVLIILGFAHINFPLWYGVCSSPIASIGQCTLSFLGKIPSKFVNKVSYLFTFKFLSIKLHTLLF